MPCPSHPAVEKGLERCERCGGVFCPDCFVAVELHKLEAHQQWHAKRKEARS